MQIDLTVEESICLLSFIEVYQRQVDLLPMKRELEVLEKFKHKLEDGLHSTATEIVNEGSM